MKQVYRPVQARLDICELETKHTERLIVESISVRSVADDRFRCAIVPSPVTSPAVKLTVAVRIVATKDYTVFVGSKDRFKDPNSGAERRGHVSKVQLEDRILRPIADDIVLGIRNDLIGVTAFSVATMTLH